MARRLQKKIDGMNSGFRTPKGRPAANSPADPVELRGHGGMIGDRGGKGKKEVRSQKSEVSGRLIPESRF
jgi:hypothetical protein